MPNPSEIERADECSAERTAREYRLAAVVFTPEESKLRRRVEELEQTLALKDILIVSQGELITAQAELLSRAAAAARPKARCSWCFPEGSENHMPLEGCGYCHGSGEVGR